jgi:hypothetical protein
MADISKEVLWLFNIDRRVALICHDEFGELPGFREERL